MIVSVESQLFSVAELGEENSLPMVGDPVETPYQITGDIPVEIIAGSKYGNPPTLYPYQEQDGYSRTREERRLTTVVLENEWLRAVLLPELGGRLWELFDKTAGKNLLHSPSTIQFANLALRDAWFAGGIEWNIGTRGHSPTTCSPLHSALVRTSTGEDVLRMWEFDRLREVVFQLDVWLPPDSKALFVAVRLRNPNDFSVPMYWWSNAAVPQLSGSRVIAPTDSAFASNYEGGISRVVPSNDGGIDCTRPTHNLRARDFFFDIDEERRRWVLAADEDGDGLAMLSTRALRGRKLFVWGNSAGGNRWQDWLTPDGGRYAEIQAGLAQTQFQHLEMPANAEWHWVEAYGNAALNPAIAHGKDWSEAVAHGENRVDSLLSQQSLDDALAFVATFADLAPRQSVLDGSGWGALEAARRERAGMPWITESGTPFAPRSLGENQRPWLELLEGDPFRVATSFVRGADWEKLLEQHPQLGAALIQRAVMAHARGAIGEAESLYRESVASAPSAIAHRGLAMLALVDGDIAGGLQQYRLACALAPYDVTLLIEAATAATRNTAGGLALELIAAFSGEASGRVQLLRAQALALVGDRSGAAAILRAGIEVASIREGENAMAQLWSEVCVGEAIPREYQFSMNSEGTA